MQPASSGPHSALVQSNHGIHKSNPFVRYNEDSRHWIAQGSYGHVFEVEAIDKSSELFAMKVMGKTHELNRDLTTGNQYLEGVERSLQQTIVPNEVKFTGKFNGHENFLKLHAAHEHDDKYWLVMEYCSGGELSKLVTREDAWMKDENDTWIAKLTRVHKLSVTKQLLSAVKYMHSQNVMHRDIKPENIMLKSEHDPKSEKEPIIKIIDFGMASDKESTNLAGSHGYIAPEVYKTVAENEKRPKEANADEEVEDMVYDKQCDVWSAGATVYEVFYGASPIYNFQSEFTEEDVKALMLTWDIKSAAIFKDCKTLGQTGCAPAEINAVLKKMLHEDPKQRITAADAWEEIVGKHLKKEYTSITSALNVKTNAINDMITKAINDMILPNVNLDATAEEFKAVVKKLQTATEEATTQLQATGQAVQDLRAVGNLPSLELPLEWTQLQNDINKCNKAVTFADQLLQTIQGNIEQDCESITTQLRTKTGTIKALVLAVNLDTTVEEFKAAVKNLQTATGDAATQLEDANTAAKKLEAFNANASELTQLQQGIKQLTQAVTHANELQITGFLKREKPGSISKGKVFGSTGTYAFVHDFKIYQLRYRHVLKAVEQLNDQTITVNFKRNVPIPKYQYFSLMESERCTRRDQLCAWFNNHEKKLDIAENIVASIEASQLKSRDWYKRRLTVKDLNSKFKSA